MYEHMNKLFLTKYRILFFLALFASQSFAQSNINYWPTKNNTFFQGFEVQVSGEILDFLPGLTNGQVALLVRANDSHQSLEFQSSIIPSTYEEEYVSLVLSAAIAKRLQEPAGEFTLHVNGTEYFKFHTHSDSTSASWNLKSGKVELSFVATEITKGSEDAFGYMFINIPTELINKGERISIRVDGGNQNSNDWFMPFGIPVVNEHAILAEPALVKTADGPKQRIRVELKHAASPSDIQFYIDKKLVLADRLTPGKRIFYLLQNPVDSPKDVDLEITIANRPKIQQTVTLNPVRKFEVYFLPHSHVDIGFTHKQDDVEKLQWRNFELGIDLAEKTKNYPDGAQFKWNAEITWAIDRYLKHANEEQKQRFINAVNNGWLGLDAMYGSQLTGIQREEEMINNQRFALDLKDKYDFDITTAMISDVPGYSWGSVEALAQSGVKYFSSGPNHMPHLPHGGYQVGHTLETWGDVPFYWASASGKEKVLFWMTSHGYSWFHSWSVDILSKAGGDPIVKFLDELENQQYPYDLVQLRYTVGNDNGPPDETMPDFIKAWNEKYEYPKMRIATNHEMMQAFEKRYGDQLPTYQGDFTPYWEDGAASSALETGINRKTADRLVQAETLSVMLGSTQNDKTKFDEAWKNVVLFSEHTWGANISKSQPDSEFTKSLWDVKQGFALDGQKKTEELINSALNTLSTKSDPYESIQIINTSSWNRTDLITIPGQWPIAGAKVTDEKGKTVESQVLSNGNLVFIAVDVPALSSKKYFLKKGKNKPNGSNSLENVSLSNQNIVVDINPETGDISALQWKGENLIDANDTLGFNAYWYGGLIKEQLQKQGSPTIELIENGAVLSKIRITSAAPGANELTREVQIVNGLDQVYLTNTVDKTKVIENENVRFSFPFDVSDGDVRIDIPWATIKPETGQLEGANKNFYSVQRWVDVSNDNMGITMATIEAPLLEIGDMNGQKWMADMERRPWIKKYEPSTRLFSWVMNNSWFVNYKAFQEGKIPFHYVLKPHDKFNDFEAKKFGIEQTQPLIVVPVERDTETLTPVLSLENNKNVIITSLKKSRDGKAIMIRFFNPTDETGSASLSWKSITPAAVYLSSSVEEKGDAIDNNISLSPWEVKTIRVEL